MIPQARMDTMVSLFIIFLLSRASHRTEVIIVGSAANIQVRR